MFLYLIENENKSSLILSGFFFPVSKRFHWQWHKWVCRYYQLNNSTLSHSIIGFHSSPHCCCCRGGGERRIVLLWKSNFSIHPPLSTFTIHYILFYFIMFSSSSFAVEGSKFNFFKKSFFIIFSAQNFFVFPTFFLLFPPREELEMLGCWLADWLTAS